MNKKLVVTAGVIALGVAGFLLYKKLKPQRDMDSPIIISDNSTHLHQKNATLSTTGGNYVVTVSEAGYSAGKLECKQGVSCTSTTLTGAWQVTIYGTYSGIPLPGVVTVIKPGRGSIVADYTNKVVTEQTDNDPEDMGGKDEVQADYTFSGFDLRNGDGTDTGILNCSGRGHCRIKIHYCPGGSC